MNVNVADLVRASCWSAEVHKFEIQQKIFSSSESRGSYEKTRDFMEFRRSRLPNSRNLWKNGGFHGVQTLEIPKVEEVVKKRGISWSSDAPDSESRGTCEKTRDFLGKKVPFFTGHPVDGFPCKPLFRAFSHSRLRKSRNFWKNGGLHGIQTLGIQSLRIQSLGIQTLRIQTLWIQTLEILKVEEFVKKLGLQRKSDTRESKSRQSVSF